MALSKLKAASSMNFLATELAAAVLVTISGCQAHRAAPMSPLASLPKLPSKPHVASAAEKVESDSLGMAHYASIGLMTYAYEHHNRLPDARRWGDVIQPYCAWHGRRFDTAILARAGDRLAMNVRLSGVSTESLPSPDDTVLLYETRASRRNAYGLPPRQYYKPSDASFPALPRQIIVFADGWFWDCAKGLPPAPAGDQKEI